MQKDPQKIRAMFGVISQWYDFMNHGCSAGMDYLWRQHLLCEVKGRISSDLHSVLDLCCGSGDVTYLFAREASTNVRRTKDESSFSVIGLDFTPELLNIALNKNQSFSRNHEVSPRFVQGDAMKTPWPDESFDAITIAFGLRNLESIEKGLYEMSRLLRPGGVLGILEFGHIPNSIVRRLFMIYFGRFMPALGRLLTGSDAYAYLRDSCLAFPRTREVGRAIRKSGLSDVKVIQLSLGVANIFTAVKETSREVNSI